MHSLFVGECPCVSLFMHVNIHVIAVYMLHAFVVCGLSSMCIHVCSHMLWLLVAWGWGDVCPCLGGGYGEFMGSSMLSILFTSIGGTWVLPGIGEPLLLGKPCD